MEAATWGLVIVTAFLAVGAFWYAVATHRIVDRMDKEREDRSRPFLAFHLVPWQPKLLKLRIQNIGPGPAFAIKGRVEAVGDGGEASFQWSYSVLVPGKFEEFGFPPDPTTNAEERFNLDIIRQRFKTVSADFTYKSASGREYPLREAINVLDVTDDWIASRMLTTQDHPERLLPRMAKALDDIVKVLRDKL